jgi:hypothetical protein
MRNHIIFMIYLIKDEMDSSINPRYKLHLFSIDIDIEYLVSSGLMIYDIGYYKDLSNYDTHLKFWSKSLIHDYWRFNLLEIQLIEMRGSWTQLITLIIVIVRIILPTLHKGGNPKSDELGKLKWRVNDKEYLNPLIMISIENSIYKTI